MEHFGVAKLSSQRLASPLLEMDGQLEPGLRYGYAVPVAMLPPREVVSASLLLTDDADCCLMLESFSSAAVRFS